MSVHFNPAHLVAGDFAGLEPADPAWLDQEAYWEDFNARFFQSNGRVYDPARDSNVKTWLTAPDRAPFSAMVDTLLTEFTQHTDLSDVDLVLLAHWMPDIHLGTSVTNFAQYKLGIEAGLGFAISDRGPSAPLFAIDMAARYLQRGRRKALVMAMDQKHLLYRSPVVDALKPRNSAAVMLLETDGAGALDYAGYTRMTGIAPADIAARLDAVCAEAGVQRADVTLIAAPEVCALSDAGPVRACQMERLCAAPFAALAEMSGTQGSVLMASYYQTELTTVLWRAAPSAEDAS